MFVSDIPDFYFAIKVKPDIFFEKEEVVFSSPQSSIKVKTLASKKGSGHFIMLRLLANF